MSKWMYVYKGKMEDIDAPDKRSAARAIMAASSDPYMFVHDIDLKLWIPENERCAWYASDSWRHCLNRAKVGTLCGVHARQAQRRSEAEAAYRKAAERGQELKAIAQRITELTGVKCSAGWHGGVAFERDNAEALVERLEALVDN
jgi:hypothetical protein